MISWYNLFKKVAFSFDPELVHELSFQLFSKLPKISHLLLSKSYQFPDHWKTEFGGLKLHYPIGLAAGLDKNALALEFLSHLPLGFIEVGTVTVRPQEGNQKPRLFRLQKEESLRNSMGFNNDGMDEILKRILSWNVQTRRYALGVNLGKNKDIPLEEAYLDYKKLYREFAPYSDYLVINVSSPNTENLRSLQGKVYLEKIFQELASSRKHYPCPLFLKISPDLNEQEINDIVGVASDFKLSGIIATNTTIMEQYGKGGVSGKLLYPRAKIIRDYLLKVLNQSTHQAHSLGLIGVGGFSTYSEIKEFLDKGGNAVQLYSAFIYQGPQLFIDLYYQYLKDHKV